MIHNPTRVVVNAEGMAVSLERAKQEYDIDPEIMFVRRDGWSLGATREFEEVAYKQWQDQWVSFARFGSKRLTPIIGYTPAPVMAGNKNQEIDR